MEMTLEVTITLLALITGLPSTLLICGGTFDTIEEPAEAKVLDT